MPIVAGAGHGPRSELAMSYDVFFQTCRFDGAMERRESLFTHKPVDVPRSAPLTDEEEDAVRGVLARACPGGPDPQDGWVLELADGGAGEVYGTNLRDGCMFALRDLTPDLVKVMFDVLVAGRWVMLPAQEKLGAIVATKDAVHRAPRDFPKVVVCETADALGVLLAGGADAWAKVRERSGGGG